MSRLALRPALRHSAHRHVAGAAEAFVGAYDDIPSIAALYGMRRALSSYESNLIRVRRSSDNAEQDFGYVANGDLDVAAIATFIGGGSGLIITWYDQSGNGNHATQTTAASQPLYVASGQNSLPVLKFDGTDDYMVLTSNITDNTISVLMVVNKHAVSSTERALLSLAGPAYYARNNSNDRWSVYVNGHKEYGTTLTATYVVLSSVVRAANDIDLVQNGAVVNITLGSSWAARGASAIGADASGVQETPSNFAELVIASAPWSTADREAAEAAANSYWSIF